MRDKTRRRERTKDGEDEGRRSAAHVCSHACKHQRARARHTHTGGYDVCAGDAIRSRITRSSDTMRISSRPTLELGRCGGAWYEFA